jgi:hypothetical protein
LLADVRATVGLHARRLRIALKVPVRSASARIASTNSLEAGNGRTRTRGSVGGPRGRH